MQLFYRLISKSLIHPIFCLNPFFLCVWVCVIIQKLLFFCIRSWAHCQQGGSISAQNTDSLSQSLGGRHSLGTVGEPSYRQGLAYMRGSWMQVLLLEETRMLALRQGSRALDNIVGKFNPSAWVLDTADICGKEPFSNWALISLWGVPPG